MAQGDLEGMNDSQVDIRQIEMFADCYHIPSYQRGYRWTKDNVTALLNDLREFRTTRKADGTRQRCYCLQPIVFQRLKDGSLIVVDGQQRLTTIAIIRYVLEGERINFGWNLYYDELNTDLRQLLTNLDADTSINGHFMREVRDAVREWRSDPMNAPINVRLNEDVLDLFLSDETKMPYEQSVFFIPYIQDLSDDEYDGQTIFIRLNDGQMNARGKPLTNWECLKAVVDGGLTKRIEEGLKLNTSWRQLIDNDWCQRLWKFCDRDIDKLHAFFADMVRSAWRVVSHDAADFTSYQLQDWLKANADGEAIRFYRELALNLEHMSNSGYKIEEKCADINKVLIDKIAANLNMILTGAPGTGKTWTAKVIAMELAGSEDRVKVVQFHPGYDYSDFVMGLKPVLLDGAGREIEGASAGAKVSVSHRWEPGVFKKFADAATADPTDNYVLVIDEINRADLSRVFGELFSLIEKDYRGASKITLPNGESFSVPANLYIIGTMNDIDRSVDSMDFALRHRFAWYEVTAESSERIIDAKMADRNADAERIKASMRILNHYIGGDKKLKVGEREIALGLGAEYQLGGAIFANAVKYRSDVDWPAMLWENHIKVILSEYLRGNRERAVILDALRAEYDKAIA